MRNLILDKAEGNPFFVEEVIRTLIDSGYIVRENNHWRATREIVNVTIPDTLTGVLSARIDRLPENTKHVAQTAAVLGRIFAHRALMATCAAAPPPERIEDVEPHLGVLTYEELVRERVHDPELEYIFKHALTQEAAYELLLIRRRKELHRRAGEVLERALSGAAGRIGIGAGVSLPAGRAMATRRRLRDARGRAGGEGVRDERSARALRECLRGAEEAPRRFARAALRRDPRVGPGRIQAQAVPGSGGRGWRRRRRSRVSWGMKRASRRSCTGSPTHTSPMASLAAGCRRCSRATSSPNESGRRTADPWWPRFWMTSGMIDRDPRGGLEQIEHVIEEARKYRNWEIEAHALATKAMAHARLGEFAEAQDAIQLAHEAVRKTDSLGERS